jgi:hypothetical protein
LTTTLPALTVAFAAFCVWLVVRIVNRRERWAKQTLAVVVGLLVLYVASFGPAIWITSPTAVPFPPTSWPLLIYCPLGRLARDSDSLIGRPLNWWARLGIRDDQYAVIPLDFTSRMEFPRRRR